MSAPARRIVFAGAGSATFAPLLLADLCRAERLGHTIVALHDIDEARLARTAALAERMLPHARSGLRFEATLSPVDAIRGADVVVSSIELDRFERWELDRDVPARLGVPQALGENGGPGGLFHALRIIPGVVELARVMERVAPHALMLNLTNPMSRICQALADYSAVRHVGLCHEIAGGRETVARVLGVPETELRVEAAGVNHFTWFTAIEDSAGADLYPALRAAYRAQPAAHVTDDRLLTADLLRVTDVHCVTNDSHAGEYLRFGHAPRCGWAPGTPPLPFFARYRRDMATTEGWMDGLQAGHVPIDELLALHSGEQVVPIIEALWNGEAWPSDALNLVNRERQLPALPDWAIVETPGHVDATGGHGRRVDGLPLWLTALCFTQASIHRLTAKAAMEGDRRAALEALLIDPTVPDVATAEQVFDALLEAHRDYLPAFG